MIKHVVRIHALVILFSSFASLHAQPIDDLIDQIVETAKQRTVRFDFTQRTVTAGGASVGRGQGLYQAPGARMDVRIDTPNGEVETVILTDGKILWHLIHGAGAPQRRVVIYDLSSPADRQASVDPFLAFGGIGTKAFTELARRSAFRGLRNRRTRIHKNSTAKQRLR